MSPMVMVALGLVGVMLAFDIMDAEMSDGTVLLLLAGSAYVAWQAFLRRDVPGITNSGAAVKWWQLLGGLLGGLGVVVLIVALRWPRTQQPQASLEHQSDTRRVRVRVVPTRPPAQSLRNTEPPRTSSGAVPAIVGTPQRSQRESARLTPPSSPLFAAGRYGFVGSVTGSATGLSAANMELAFAKDLTITGSLSIYELPEGFEVVGTWTQGGEVSLVLTEESSMKLKAQLGLPNVRGETARPSMFGTFDGRTLNGTLNFGTTKEPVSGDFRFFASES